MELRDPSLLRQAALAGSLWIEANDIIEEFTEIKYVCLGGIEAQEIAL